MREGSNTIVEYLSRHYSQLLFPSFGGFVQDGIGCMSRE